MHESDTAALFLTPDPIPFDRIRAEHLVPGARDVIERAERELDEIRAVEDSAYGTTLGVLDATMERVHRVMAVAGHLNAVSHDDEMEAAYSEVVGIASEFSSRLSTDPRLLELVEAVLATELEPDERRHATLTAEGLRRSGAGLDPDKRKRLRELNVRLSERMNQFGVNSLKATNATTFEISDEEDLAGLPERHRVAARRRAEEAGKPGWLVTLQQPSAGPVLQYSEVRELRRKVYEARMNLAVEAPHDNREILREILAIRQEIADILEKATWAEHVLEDSMAKRPKTVLEFIEELTTATEPEWEADKQAIREIAQEYGYSPVEAWDLSFLTERLRERDCDLTDEAVRPYFELQAVVAGAFEVARRIFGVEIRAVPLPAWHQEVKTYEVSRAGTPIAHLYADWHPRGSKRSGAWMNVLRRGGPTRDGMHEVHSVLVCGNFTSPDEDGRSLLNHNEATTLFHEFGHALHQCVATARIRALSGVNVYTDWVEVPSQIMENWAWEADSLRLFAAHVETGEEIPAELIERLRSTRHHLEAMARMRQLSFGALDMALHAEPAPESYPAALRRAQEASRRYAMRPEFADNQFITGFNHLFSGMYSAGYYSYLWSETLQADLFSAFENGRLFDRETGERFVTEILARGNEAEPIEMFRAFMGRDPDYSALVKRGKVGRTAPA